ncbi:12952_t:CDS:1, partial [Gigaspora rosea]
MQIVFKLFSKTVTNSSVLVESKSFSNINSTCVLVLSVLAE